MSFFVNFEHIAHKVSVVNFEQVNVAGYLLTAIPIVDRLNFILNFMIPIVVEQILINCFYFVTSK